MGAPPGGGGVLRSGLDALVTFNHWLSLTRLRAAGAVMLFTLGLAWLRVGNISTPYACAVCAGLFAVSGIGLSWPSLARAPRLFFYLQSLADLAAIDRKSTRLNSSHLVISYAVFCLKKKKKLI